jgi:hypothetical protein
VSRQKKEPLQSISRVIEKKVNDVKQEGIPKAVALSRREVFKEIQLVSKSY